MINPSVLETLADRILQALPPGLIALSEDAKDILRDLMKEQLLKLDLVPRDEFDIQCSVLARTEAKLSELEKLLANLEEKMRNTAI